MSLRYRYTMVRRARAVPSLGGRFVRPRPLIPVTIIGLTGSRTRDALLDTGADDTIFPEELAAKVGLDLTHAPQGLGAGWGTARVVLRYGQVVLRIASNAERREWQAWVGFTPAKSVYPVLGFAGFLQFFDTRFFGGGRTDRQPPVSRPITWQASG